MKTTYFALSGKFVRASRGDWHPPSAEVAMRRTNQVDTGMVASTFHVLRAAAVRWLDAG